MLAAQEKVLAACPRHGVAPGIHVVEPDGELVRRRLAQGFRFIACGLDTLLIQKGCRAMLKQLSAVSLEETAPKSARHQAKSLPVHA